MKFERSSSRQTLPALTPQVGAKSRFVEPFIPFAISVFVFCVLWVSVDIPLTWDEGDYVQRADGIIRWFSSLASFDATVLTHEGIHAAFPFTTQKEGHPALFAILIALGKIASSTQVPLHGYRVGTILLHSFALGLAFARLRGSHGYIAGLMSVAISLTMPRMFGHQHFATNDGQLTSWWIVAMLAAPLDRRFTSGSLILWGLSIGACMSTKFTGWFIWFPTIAWFIFRLYDTRHPWASVRHVTVLVASALATFVACNPPTWHDPFGGIVTFLQLNLGRAHHFHIRTYFLGQLYDSLNTLPWYNTLVWTYFTVPLQWLLFSLAGFATMARREPATVERASLHTWLFLNWLTPMVLRALPGAPPHDGVRLFLPAFGVLSIIAAIGATDVYRTFASKSAAHAILVTSVACGAFNTWWYSPQYLSYYSFQVGGLRGATEMGMEPTYWWDALDADVYSWIATHVPVDETIGTSILPNVDLLRKWGLITHEFRIARSDDDFKHVQWFLVHNRPSSLTSRDHWIKTNYSPVFSKTIRPRSPGFGPWRLDVSLIDVYAISADTIVNK